MSTNSVNNIRINRGVSRSGSHVDRSVVLGTNVGRRQYTSAVSHWTVTRRWPSRVSYNSPRGIGVLASYRIDDRFHVAAVRTGTIIAGRCAILPTLRGRDRGTNFRVSRSHAVSFPHSPSCASADVRARCQACEALATWPMPTDDFLPEESIGSGIWPGLIPRVSRKPVIFPIQRA